MKNAKGNYFRMSSAKGFDNLGLKIKFEIIIIFKEEFEISEDVFETLDLMLEGALRGLAMENPLAKKDDVAKQIKVALNALDYEYSNIFIDQSVNYKED